MLWLMNGLTVRLMMMMIISFTTPLIWMMKKDSYQIRCFEKSRSINIDYLCWMYAGDFIGLGDMVYNMNHFQTNDKLPEDDDVMLIPHQIQGTKYQLLLI